MEANKLWIDDRLRAQPLRPWRQIMIDFNNHPDVHGVGAGFDPDKNTAAFLAHVPDYSRHGVRAFTLCLQGGMPGYEGAINSAFDDTAALRRYVEHPEHQAGVALWREFSTWVIADYEF